MAKKKFYVVWFGHKPGIYLTWEECQQQIDSFPGAKYKSFPSIEAAEAAMKAGPEKKGESEFLHFLNAEHKPEMSSISVDAACKGNPGMMEYRGVYTDGASELFRLGPFPDGNNNVGEFLALVHGLAWVKQKKLNLMIYSDSKTAMSWVRNRKAKSKLKRTRKNAYLFELIGRAEKWLLENKSYSEIKKWNTQLWGEIPADFGRK